MVEYDQYHHLMRSSRSMTALGKRYFTMRAEFPTTTAYGGTSFVMTARADDRAVADADAAEDRDALTDPDIVADDDLIVIVLVCMVRIGVALLLHREEILERVRADAAQFMIQANDKRHVLRDRRIPSDEDVRAEAARVNHCRTRIRMRSNGRQQTLLPSDCDDQIPGVHRRFGKA